MWRNRLYMALSLLLLAAGPRPARAGDELVGAVLGGVLGGVVGHQSGHRDEGIALGAILGSLATRNDGGTFIGVGDGPYYHGAYPYGGWRGRRHYPRQRGWGYYGDPWYDDYGWWQPYGQYGQQHPAGRGGEGHDKTVLGAVLGGVAGGVIGHQFDDGGHKYRNIGIAAGALTGGLLGHRADRKDTAERKHERAAATRSGTSESPSEAAPEVDAVAAPERPRIGYRPQSSGATKIGYLPRHWDSSSR